MSSRAAFSCAGSDAVATDADAMHLTAIALCDHHTRVNRSHESNY